MAGFNALAWSPDGSRLTTAAGDGVVKLIERYGGGELLSLRMPPSDATVLAWSPGGKRLAAADASGSQFRSGTRRRDTNLRRGAVRRRFQLGPMKRGPKREHRTGGNSGFYEKLLSWLQSHWLIDGCVAERWLG